MSTRDDIVNLLAQAMPSTNDQDAKTRAEQILNTYRNQVARAATDAAALDVLWRMKQSSGDYEVENLIDHNPDLEHLRDQV